MMLNFALVGLAGYVAPRHLKAIQDTGNRLVAAVDPHDSVGILDSYFPEAAFFTSSERFDRHLNKLRHGTNDKKIHYVSICTPNHLHDAHIRSALRANAHAICEKPLVITPSNLDELELLEQETGQNIYTVLQLRLHPSLITLKKQLAEHRTGGKRADVELTYITRRGVWYRYSWKGDTSKSGGLAMNIGIHFFDLLLWVFGDCYECYLYADSDTRMSGVLELESARVKWFLSIDGNDLPPGYLESGRHAYRSITIDGVDVEFSEGFTDLHTEIYQDILNGGGFRIKDARPSIELVDLITRTDVRPVNDVAHPFISKVKL